MSENIHGISQVTIEGLTKKVAELEANSVSGWRSCIDHIIKPKDPCPVCRINELEAVSERLMVLATKWIDIKHHEWDEIVAIAKAKERK